MPQALGHTVDEVFIFLSRDLDGAEAVVGAMMENGATVPLVAADRARMEALLPMAQSIANMSGMRITVARLHERTDEQVIAPAE